MNISAFSITNPSDLCKVGDQLIICTRDNRQDSLMPPEHNSKQGPRTDSASLPAWELDTSPTPDQPDTYRTMYIRAEARVSKLIEEYGPCLVVTDGILSLELEIATSDDYNDRGTLRAAQTNVERFTFRTLDDVRCPTLWIHFEPGTADSEWLFRDADLFEIHSWFKYVSHDLENYRHNDLTNFAISFARFLGLPSITVPPTL